MTAPRHQSAATLVAQLQTKRYYSYQVVHFDARVQKRRTVCFLCAVKGLRYFHCAALLALQHALKNSKITPSRMQRIVLEVRTQYGIRYSVHG